MVCEPRGTCEYEKRATWKNGKGTNPPTKHGGAKFFPFGAISSSKYVSMAQSRLRAYFRGQAADLKNAGQKQDLSNQPKLHGKAKEKPQGLMAHSHSWRSQSICPLNLHRMCVPNYKGASQVVIFKTATGALIGKGLWIVWHIARAEWLQQVTSPILCKAGRLSLTYQNMGSCFWGTSFWGCFEGIACDTNPDLCWTSIAGAKDRLKLPPLRWN